MKGKNDYLINKLRDLDDESFIEVFSSVTEKAANTQEKINDDLVHISEVKDQVRDWLSTGYSELDNRIKGLGKGHVILIGGETSNGKSALATNIAINVSKNFGVLYITLEMLHEELKERIKLANNGTVDDLDIMFQREFRISYKDIEPTIKKAREMGEVKMVVLDYLQYLGRGMTLDEVARMSKEIKTLALKYEVPMLVIVSLRKSEAGKGKRKWTDIEIEDFMGTGSIGYDCDTAMIASRKDKDNEFDETGIWVKVLKTRNSKLDYNDRFIRFTWDKTRIIEDWIQPAKQHLDFTEAGK